MEAMKRRRRTLGPGTGSVPTNVLIPRHHRLALRRLSEKTRISQSAFLREAIADLLAKYEARSEAAAERGGSDPAGQGHCTSAA